MSVSVQVTPLWVGVDGAPAGTLLSFDDTVILLDCGWNPSLDSTIVKKYEEYVLYSMC